MLATDSMSVRAERRQVDFISIAIVCFGLAMLIAGVALFYGGFHRLEIVAVGLLGSARTLALAMIVLAVSIVASRLGPALRSLRPVGHDAAGTLPFVSHRSFGPPAEEIPFSAIDLVALKLSEPNLGAEMALGEAVRQAYQQSQTSAAACFANTFADEPDDIVKMYATFIAEHVPIYGCKRPSSTVEQVSLSSPLKEFQIEDGCLVLKERAGTATYDHLRIKAADYSVVLERLATAS